MGPRMDLRTTVTLSRVPSLLLRFRARSLLMTRRSLRMPLKSLSNGLMPMLLLRRRNMKRSKRHLRELPCQSFNPWLVLLEELQELVVCQEVCQTLAELLQELVHHLLMIQHLDQPLKKSIKKRHVSDLNPC